jgi:hypothetical protein
MLTTWPQTRGTVPVTIRGIARLFPHRATLPVAPLGTLGKAQKATGTRLACTESSDPAFMWVWARTLADTEAASAVMPTLEFGEHDGTGER